MKNVMMVLAAAALFAILGWMSADRVAYQSKVHACMYDGGTQSECEMKEAR